MGYLVKPPKPQGQQGYQPQSLEGVVLYRLWRMAAWMARLVARHPWRTVWALAVLGFWGSHAWVLVGLTLGLPVVVIGLYRHGPRTGLLERWGSTRALLDRRDEHAARGHVAKRLQGYRQAFEAQYPYIAPATEYGEIPQPVEYGEHRFGWWVDLRLPVGMAPHAIEERRDQLAHALGVRRLDVASTKPGMVRLSFYTSDPLATNDEPGNKTSGLPQLPPFEVGVLDTGDPMVWDPGLSPHMLVVGQTRSGKSAFLRTLLYSLPSDGSWEVGICDFKRVEFGLYRPGGKKIVAVATAHKDIADLADMWQTDMMARLDEMVRAGAGRADELPYPVPHRLLVIDEYMTFVASAEDARGPRRPPKPKKGEEPEEPEEGISTMVARTKAAVAQLSLLGGAANYHVILGAHQPTATLFGSAGKRSQYRAIVALRALDRDGCSMVFQGADVEEVRSKFDGKQGHGVCVNVGGDEAGTVPHAFRTHFIPGDKRTRDLICGM